MCGLNVIVIQCIISKLISIIISSHNVTNFKLHFQHDIAFSTPLIIYLCSSSVVHISCRPTHNIIHNKLTVR